jgi:hypothetical protein
MIMVLSNTSAPYNELHPVKCNKLAECALEFVTWRTPKSRGEPTWGITKV